MVLVDGGEPAPDVVWRKHLALLVYLALSPDHARSREHLLGLLWPEKSQNKARHSLNEALRRLRASLGAARLVSRGETVQLSDFALEVDALQFNRLADRDPSHAIGLLKGEFLEGFVLDDAPAFEEWAEAQRTQFRSRAAALLLGVGEAALAASRFQDAQEVARRGLRLNPSSETAANLLMRAAALGGDATGALRAYHEFRGRLQREIHEEPSRELRALAERIRTERWRRASSRYAELDPPLVGRSDTHRRVFELLDAGIKSGTQCLVLVGDPGMGKTRLLNECVDRLALAGASLAVARPLESDHDAPWSTLRLLIRSGLRSAPGAAATDPRALAVLASLVPELAERVPATAPQDTSEVVSAFVSLVKAVADEQPVGLLVDDSHLGDGVSLGVLGAAIGNLGGARVVLVLAAESSAENVPRELLRLICEVGRSIEGEVVRLDPLTLQAMHDLVSKLATWCDTPDELQRLTRRLTYEAGGNPFLAVTLLRDLDRTSTLKDDLVMWPTPTATLETPLPFSVPQLARMAIVARVSDLDEECQQVLRAASIGSRALDIPLTAALAELPVERVEDLLDQLEEKRFVTYDGGRYAFAAALLPQVISGECMTRGQRQRLYKRAILVLASRDDLESRVLRAELRARVEPGVEAFEEAVAAVRMALEVGSDRTARRALVAAERAVDEGDDARRSVIQELREALER